MGLASTSHAIVSEQQWVEARKALLEKEKEFTRLRDELSQLRRELPWTPIRKNYEFDTADGRKTLSELFGARSQLIVYHFMFAPGSTEGCKVCSFVADHLDGAALHLAHRDTALVVVSRATLSELDKFKQRMGWGFEWVSSNQSDFNSDFQVSFDPQRDKSSPVDYNFSKQIYAGNEAPGLSVFYRQQNGEVFHTYSTYARGLDLLLGTYNLLDLTPKGRDEGQLSSPMSWIRHHDRYNVEDTPDTNRAQGQVA